jgi:hypothetical protein
MRMLGLLRYVDGNAALTCPIVVSSRSLEEASNLLTVSS